MAHIVCLGEATIDLFAGTGVALRDAKALHPAPGGAPANVAVALARLGADVGFVGKVGADDFGALLIDLLADEGVDVTHFTADERAPTMLAVVVAPNPGEQRFWTYHGADTLLRPEELERSYIETADVFAYGAVTFAHASRDAALQAARWAREAGCQVIFDVNLRPTVWPSLEVARCRTREGIASASVVKLNQEELHFLTGTPDAAVGTRELIKQGVGLCCVSLGAGGAYFDNGAVAGHVPAFVVDVLDTTGSGDAFVAGLAYGLCKQHLPVECLREGQLRTIVRFANACGALAATRIGAMSALPTRAEVERLLGATGSVTGRPD